MEGRSGGSSEGEAEEKWVVRLDGVSERSRGKRPMVDVVSDTGG